YRYRVDVLAKDSSVTFSSGGRPFRRMVQMLLPRIAEHKLDARACDLRDHLANLNAIKADAARLGIATPAVLENAREEAENRIEKRRRQMATETSEQELERAALLRRAANDLRIAGCLQ